MKDDQREKVARKLAELTGETLTEAIRTADAEKYEPLRHARSGRSLADDLIEIALRCAKRPVVSNLTDEEILGYDELRIPTR